MSASTLRKAVLFGALALLLAAAMILTGEWFAARARRASFTHSRTRTDLEVVALELELRAFRNGGVFDRTLPPLELVQVTGRDPDLRIDPWGRPLLYVPPSNGLDGHVWTLGRDGRIGGVGDDEDLRHPVHASMACGEALAKDIEED